MRLQSGVKHGHSAENGQEYVLRLQACMTIKAKVGSRYASRRNGHHYAKVVKLQTAAGNCL